MVSAEPAPIVIDPLAELTKLAPWRFSVSPFETSIVWFLKSSSFQPSPSISQVPW